MAYSRQSRDESAKSVNTAVSSTDDFFQLLLDNLNRGAIKKGTLKKVNRVQTWLRGNRFMHHTSVIGNLEMSTVKTAGAPVVPDSQAPIYQLNKTSQLQRRLKPLANTVWAMCDLKCIVPHAYFMTITVANCDAGQLESTQAELWRAFNLLNRINQHARGGRAGLGLPAADGTTANWLGDYASMETTVNAKKLAANDPHGLLHPHIHVVVITDKELDLNTMVSFSHSKMTQSMATMPAAAASLFQFMLANLNTQRLSPDAFTLKPAEKRFKKQSTFDAFTASMVETTKYSVKPDAWGRLFGASKNPKTRQLALDIFAELYNAHFGKTMRRNHGMIWQAVGFLNWCVEHGLGQAVMAGQYKNQPSDSNIPDMMTTRAELGTVKTTRVDSAGQLHSVNIAGFVKQANLTAEQIVYFNQAILARTGFDAALLNQVKFGDSDKSRLYKSLLKNMRYLDHGKSGLIARVDAWAGATKDPAKQLDLTAVRDALESQLDDNGYIAYCHDWRKRAYLISAVEMLQNAEYKPAYSDSGIPLAKLGHGQQSAEKLALDLFGATLLGGSFDAKFITMHVDSLLYLAEKHHIDHDLLTQVLWHSYERDDAGRLTVNIGGDVVALADNPALAAVLSKIESLAGLICDADCDPDEKLQYTDSKIDSAEKLQAIIDTIG